MDAEACCAGSLLAGTDALGDVAGNVVVAGSEARSVDVSGDVGSCDVSSADGPGVLAFFFGLRLAGTAVTTTGSPGKMLAGWTVQPN